MTNAVVIGAGPAGLMAADVLSAAGVRVTIVDRMPSVGRKFLMAGKSGLNLTKAEPIGAFLDRYWSLSDPMRDAVRDFGPDDVTRWAEDLGQDVFTGSTGRVFPKVMKASPLLRAWLARLAGRDVAIKTRWTWKGWEDGALAFQTAEGSEHLRPDITILALGGGSWSRLGSDGRWLDYLPGVAPFQPSNCGFAVEWSPYMAKHFGAPIKSTVLMAGESRSRGEWILSARGIEGGGIYEVSAALRDGAPLQVDLLPDVSLDKLEARWAARSRKATVAHFLKSVLRLAPVKVALVQEVAAGASLSMPGAIKALPIALDRPFPLDEAISTAGGLKASALGADFMLGSQAGVFCAGEMLDWDAPTGGYLLTACLASGRAAARGALRWAGQ